MQSCHMHVFTTKPMSNLDRPLLAFFVIFVVGYQNITNSHNEIFGLFDRCHVEKFRVGISFRYKVEDIMVYLGVSLSNNVFLRNCRFSPKCFVPERNVIWSLMKEEKHRLLETKPSKLWHVEVRAITLNRLG